MGIAQSFTTEVGMMWFWYSTFLLFYSLITKYNNTPSVPKPGFWHFRVFSTVNIIIVIINIYIALSFQETQNADRQL